MKFLVFFLLLFVMLACNELDKDTAEKKVTIEQPLDSSYISAVEEGKALFLTHCSTCHAVNNDLTGPALAGVESRWKEKNLLYGFIKNSDNIIAKDAYAKDLFNRWNKVKMNNFEWLKDKQIEHILQYIQSVTELK
ncbi:MAG: c-type cytochrome [Chitinophagaceae bacterium]